MSSSNRYHLDNPIYDNHGSTTTMIGSKQEKGGCHVTTVTGFILLLLAVLIAVGVGIIVHFAGNGKEVNCNCNKDSVPGIGSAEAIKQECLDMASSGDMDICSQCPSDGMATSTTSSPTPLTTTTTSSTTTTSTTSSAPTTQDPATINYRLPNSVVPVHYDLELQPNVFTGNPLIFALRGQVSILIKCQTSTDTVTLHSLGLSVSGIEFHEETSTTSDSKYLSHDFDLERQFLIIKLSQNLTVGTNYLLGINFTSSLQEERQGVYYESYDNLGQRVYLATTQFYPAYARKAFPCFDEPSLIATFNMTIIRPQDQTSISNMPLLDSNQTITERGVMWVKDVYQQSPKISTYLLSFVVSDFQFVESITRNNVTFRICSQPSSLNRTQHALDIGMDILSTLADLLEEPYPLSKLDIALLPEMSRPVTGNLGLILYSETTLLRGNETSSERNSYDFVMEMSKLLARQWVGGMITIAWWNDIWISNGFANFLSYMTVDLLHPEWKVFDKFVIDETQEAFSLDGFDLSRPLYSTVQKPSDVDEFYGEMLEKKVAALLRMVGHFLGPNTFINGIRTYLSNLPFYSTSHTGLWLTLRWQASQDNKILEVLDIMNTWTNQQGYPVVLLSPDFANNDRIYVQQDVFELDWLVESPGLPDSTYGYKWTIPVTLTSNKQPGLIPSDINVHWLFKEEAGKYLYIGQHNLPDLNDTDGWALANLNMFGYYRVNYQRFNWLRLAKQLKRDYQVISPVNKAQIISDVWNLANARYVPRFDTAMILSDYLNVERDYLPWAAAKKELGYVGRMLSLVADYGPFQNFMQDKLNASYHYYGLTNTGASHMETYARKLIVEQACRYGLPECLDDVTSLFREWMMNYNLTNPIDINMRRVVYCSAIANGGTEVWEFVYQAFIESNNEEEKTDLLLGMTCTEKTWLLNDFLTRLNSVDSPIPRRLVPQLLTSMTSTGVGRLLVWNFFKTYLLPLNMEFGGQAREWSNLIKALTENFNTQAELDDLKAFIEDKAPYLESVQPVLNLVMERIATNIKWMIDFVPQIGNWLRTSGY